MKAIYLTTVFALASIRIRRITGRVVSTHPIPVGYIRHQTRVGITRCVARNIGDLGKSGAVTTHAALDLHTILLCIVVYPGQINLPLAERLSNKVAWSSQDDGVHDDRSGSRVRRTAIVGDGEGRRITPRGSCTGALPVVLRRRLPSPNDQAQDVTVPSGSVDPEPSKATFKGADPVVGVMDITAIGGWLLVPATMLAMLDTQSIHPRCRRLLDTCRWSRQLTEESV